MRKFHKTEEKAQGIKTLQADIVQRVMSPTEFQAFLEKYEASKKSYGGMNRFMLMESPLIEVEKKALYAWLFKEDKTVDDLLPNKSGQATKSLVLRAALKVLYRNRKRLDELMEGGEEVEKSAE